MRIFENIEVGNEVSFTNSKGLIETGVCVEVSNNKFKVRSISSWVKPDGTVCYDDIFHNFFKTGTKTHSHHCNGNAISYTKSPEQMLS